MGLLRKEDLLKKSKLNIERVDLGEGDFLFVREMTGREREEWESSITKVIRDNRGMIEKYESALDDFRAKICVYTACDEKGDRILTVADVEALSQNMSAKKLVKLADAAQKLNRISEEEKEALLKNSGAGPAGSSNLDSVKS
jgi:hypothetical protein